jgi:hypothetical protein
MMTPANPDHYGSTGAAVAQARRRIEREDWLAHLGARGLSLDCLDYLRSLPHEAIMELVRVLEHKEGQIKDLEKELKEKMQETGQPPQAMTFAEEAERRRRGRRRS